MTRRLLLGFVLGVMVQILPVEEEARARSIYAYTGKARQGEHRTCFVRGPTHAVRSLCSEDFIVPLNTDNSGSKTLTFTSRATASGAQCRAVGNNRYGTAQSASAFKSIPTDANFLSRTTASVVVPSNGVFFGDCRMNPGSELFAFDYAR